MPRLLLVLAVALTAAACAPPPPAAAVRDAVAGQPFTVEVGEAIRVDDRVVRVVSVEDGRCPQNVECVWAGAATVTVDVGGRVLTLSTQEEDDADAPIRLWEVTPYPGSPASLDGAPVRVSLEVLPAGD